MGEIIKGTFGVQISATQIAVCLLNRVKEEEGKKKEKKQKILTKNVTECSKFNDSTVNAVLSEALTCNVVILEDFFGKCRLERRIQ